MYISVLVSSAHLVMSYVQAAALLCAVIFMDDDGLLNVTGGKWTTYRRMAEETVDAAVASGRLPLNTRPCVTQTLPLIGAQEYRRTLYAEVCGFGIFCMECLCLS